MHMLHAYEVIKTRTEDKRNFFITFLADEVTVSISKQQVYQLAEETWVSADAILFLLAILKYSWLMNSRNVKNKLPRLKEYEVNSSLALLLDNYMEEELIERFFFMKYADIVAIFKSTSPCDEFLN